MSSFNFGRRVNVTELPRVGLKRKAVNLKELKELVMKSKEEQAAEEYVNRGPNPERLALTETYAFLSGIKWARANPEENIKFAPQEESILGKFNEIIEKLNGGQ
jgi:hypothetical protein